jgi:hypothetical protein
MRYTDEEVIFKYIDNNYSINKTSEELGMSWNTVKKILNDNDIESVNIQDNKSVDVGRKVGELSIKKRLENKFYPSGSQDKQFLCECICGTEVVVMGSELRKGKKTHCGCKSEKKKSYIVTNIPELFPREPITIVKIGIPKSNGKYKIGDTKDKLTILMKKSEGDYVDSSDELFVECECGMMSKMMYDEFINSTCCGCDNNG